MAAFILGSPSVTAAAPDLSEATGAADVLSDAPSRVQLELVWYEGTLVPGREANLGVILNIEPHWHIQAGARSGDQIEGYLPTTIDLVLPAGWTSHAVLWPEAKTFTLGAGEFAETLRGYEGRTMAVIPVVVPQGAPPGTYPVTVKVGYQACDDNFCEPLVDIEATGSAHIAEPGSAAVEGPALDDTTARMFTAALTRSVPTVPNTPAPARGASSPQLSNLHWWIALLFTVGAMVWMIVRTFAVTRRPAPRVFVTILGLAFMALAFVFVRGMTAPSRFQWQHYDEQALSSALASGDKTVLVKFTAAWCANCHVNERIIMADDDAVKLLTRPDVVPLKADLTSTEAEGWDRLRALGGGGIPAIAVYRPGESDPILIRGQLLTADPVIDAVRGETTNLSNNADLTFDFLNWQFTVKRDATLLILLLAALAGFFMNFTPCVLPVVPLKILSLQAHAKEPARCFFLGLVFGLGIVALYAMLGVLIAGLITGVERLDWGQLFSFWWFSGLVGLIVGIMALGMLGLFNVRLPQFVYMFNPQSDTATGSFFMGVFTALLSTPCTGPLLGATIAWVVTKPAWLAFLTLLVMGVGMAFPYVLLTARPQWLAKLPRTGPGSELVKQVMGLLLLAVASFFIGIAVQSYGA